MTRIQFNTSMKELHDSTLALGSMVDKAIAGAVEAFDAWDPALARRVMDSDEAINQARWALEERAVNLVATQAPMAGDLRRIVAIIHVATELERMADYAKVVARTVVRSPNAPELATRALIPRLAALCHEQLMDVLDAFVDMDAEWARRIAKRDDQIDQLWDRSYRELLAEMIADPSVVPHASNLLWIAHNFERVGDRVTNICERIVYAATGQFEENVHLAGVSRDDEP